MSPHPNSAGTTDGPSGARAVLIDAMGTLVRLRPPVPLLEAALADAGYPNPPRVVAAALAQEIRYYRANHLRGSTPEHLSVLRRDCARVLVGRLETPPPIGLAQELLLRSIRIEPFPDARAFLETAHARGVAVVVVSDWDCSLRETLARIGLGAALDGVVVSADVGAAKPAAAPFTAALDLAGVAAGRALHCGDDPARDLAGAAAAGIRAVLCDRDDRFPDVAPRVASLAELWRWI